MNRESIGLFSVLLVVVPAALAGILIGTAVGGGNPCTGSGVTEQTILCSGACTPGECKPRSRQVLGQTAVFCGCEEGQQGWPCCYLLQWTSGEDEGEFFVLGDCVACSLPGNCVRGGSGTLEDPYNAECDTTS